MVGSIILTSRQDSISLIKELIADDDQYVKFINQISSGGRVKISGASGSLSSFLAGAVFDSSPKDLLVVAESLVRAEEIRDDLETIIGDRDIFFYPESGRVTGGEAVTMLSFQSHALQAMISKKRSLIVTTFRGLLEYGAPPQKIFNKSIRLKLSEEINLQNLILRLIEIGYEQEKMVSHPFEFSVRGGIVDIFPVSFEHPIRMELFGDTIDSIREFNVITQRSHKNIKNINIAPDIQLEIFTNGPKSNLLSYLREKSFIWVEQKDLIKKIEDDIPELTLEDELQRLDSFGGVDVVSFYSKDTIKFETIPPTKYRSSINGLLKDLHNWVSNNENCFIACENEFHRERINNIIEIGGVEIQANPLSSGFHLPSVNLHVLTDHEIFERRRKKRTFKKFSSVGTPIKNLAGLEIGNYLVHMDYGIGEYRGMKKIRISGAMRECLKIVYAAGDKIFLPVENFKRVQKYKAAEGIKPKLNRLGTGEWDRIKQKTKNAASKIARDLVELYAKRLSTVGFKFQKDDDMHWALESSFQFEETADQLASMEEIKSDMEKPFPMDRLLCGDVGFGKTEVALRAAFKAAVSGKQTAILVPTTILADQHYKTFSQRLKPFPVTVEALSRFQTKKRQVEILQGVKSGTVDILIGTHRLLSNDVEFKDMGLLIIDEEHRFGVRQKELFKSLRLSVDILSMTATPIPRTLNFSLLGARDISFINTPPENRLPIYTEITSLEEGVVRDAILREVERKGQVFFVHNKVQSIERMHERLKAWVPQVRICVAHGQMKPRELERVMSDFMDGEYEVLLSTMIIESGLDIPNVNTILINRADRFGLSQIYQLRGRVGRSESRAFAYLLIPPTHKLTPTALSRLKALEAFSNLGSGFSIAMRDLEIRGAGNLLGTKQSGFIESVGFEMYNRLVGEEVEALKSGLNMQHATTHKTDPEVRCDIDAYLPDTFIDDGEARIEFYQRMASLTDISEVQSLSEEIVDRYGTIPMEANNLLMMTTIKILASYMNLVSIDIKEELLIGIIGSSDDVKPEHSFFRSLSTAAGIEEYNISINTGNNVSFKATLGKKSKLESAISLLETFSE